MILYLDTSALIKKYVHEDGSEDVVAYWNKSDIIVTSSVAFAEFFSALNRKKRECSISDEDYKSLIHDFKDDWDSFLKIEVNDRLNHDIEKIAGKYSLRGFDAIHLVSAINIYRLKADTVFICADRRLNDAAQKEFINIVDLS